jgi:hypothetical protein
MMSFCHSVMAIAGKALFLRQKGLWGLDFAGFGLDGEEKGQEFAC